MPSFFIMTEEKKLKILCVPANEGGCSYYRIICPMRKLEELHGDKVEIRWDKNPLGIDEKTGKWLKVHGASGNDRRMVHQTALDLGHPSGATGRNFDGGQTRWVI